MKYILPYHLGCGNRGCEGICRGISTIFGLKPEELVLYNMTNQEYLNDLELKLGEVAQLRYKGNAADECVRFVTKALRKLKIPKPYLRFKSDFYLKDAQPGDVFLMTGGDIYCYSGGYVLPNMIARKAKKKGVKTVLYCSSFEKEFLTEEAVRGIAEYDVVITRESLSAELMNSLNIKNTLVPDPAFALEPSPVSLPDYFGKRPVVGLNFSPYTNSSEVFEQNIMNLCRLCDEMGMDVCLIPHVFWKGQDDREAIRALMPKLGNNVHYLDTSRMGYLQIRYVISKCKFFIGGRTHSVISAYSTKVPCIALGYSVKSRGIALDLGLPEYTVVDSKRLKTEHDITDAFKKLCENEQSIRSVYESRLEGYARRSRDAKDVV